MAMPEAEPGLVEQFTTARAKVALQIDLLRARPYPYPEGGLSLAILMFIFGCFGPPFRTNGIMTDNSVLIARLTNLQHRIDQAMEELGAAD
jgi:hypothetical protein